MKSPIKNKAQHTIYLPEQKPVSESRHSSGGLSPEKKKEYLAYALLGLSILLVILFVVLPKTKSKSETDDTHGTFQVETELVSKETDDIEPFNLGETDEEPVPQESETKLFYINSD